MDYSWKASFFIVILVSSISTSNFVSGQSYSNSSNNTVSNPSSVFCGYDLWGDLYLSEHGTADLCNSKGTPTLLSKSKDMLSPDGIQQLVGRDRQLYAFMWLRSTTVSYSDLQISKMCQYDKNGNFVASLSEIQREVLTDLKNNFGVYICPFTGTPMPPLPPPETHTGAAKLLGVTPAMPKCQSGEVIMADVCLSRETTCPPGFGMWDANICAFSKPSCPSDSVSGNGVCTLFTPKRFMEFTDWGVLPLSCPQGTYLNGICVLTSQVQPTPTLTCPEGYGFQKDSNFCVMSSTLPRQTCPFGTVLQGDVCVAANIQKDKVLPLANDPRSASVDLDYPSCVLPEGCPSNSTKNNNASKNLSVNDISTIHSKESFSSPMKQEKSGISVKDIQCKQGLVLLVKAKNGHIGCVKPVSVTRLLSHGWITPGKFVLMHPVPKYYENNTQSLSIGKITSNNTTRKDVSISKSVNAVPTKNLNHSTIILSPGITTPTISSNKQGIKILSIQMSPDPLKVGDMPIFTIIYQNISNKIMGHQTGCTASSLGYTLSPSDYVQELPPGAVACADQLQSIQPNATATDYGRSYHLDGFYKIVREGTLNVTMHLYLQKDDPLGLDLVETIQFNVNATNTPLSNNSAASTNQTYYPVYVSPAGGTMNESALPPITEIPTPPAVSTTPLPPITEPTILNYSDLNATKILAVGMSPNPLKVGDNQRFTVTYKNISGKPLYGITGCGWDLSYAISSSNVERSLRLDLPTCAEGFDIIEPSQTVTEEAGSSYNYKIIQPGLLQVTLALSLRPHEDFSQVINDTIQFNVNATQ